MTKITELTKNVDTRPFYALVGATDLTVEKAREAADAAEDFGAQMRAEFDKIVADLAPAKVQDRAEAAIAEVKDLPHQAAVTRKASMEKWAARYEDLATRGKKLVERIRGQKATQDLMAQADATMATAKGAMTTATKAAKDVERSAKATITTGRSVSSLTGWESSTPAGRTSSERRTPWPSSTPARSTAMNSGRSFGRQPTSTSVARRWMTPPALRPAQASSLRKCSGTRMCRRRLALTRCRSTCRSWRL